MPLLHREEIINYLAEIAMGNLSLTLDKIEQEADTETRELLFGLLCLHEDLVLQRQEVASLNQFLQNILQSFSELLFIISSTGHIQMVNKQSLDSIQKENHKVIHHPIDSFLGTVQDTPEHIVDIFENSTFPYARVVDMIEHQQFVEIPMMLKSMGEDFPVLVTGHLMEASTNLAANIILSAKDGRQSRLLQELQEKQLQLVQASKLASMGELASGIAHELNNPLFAVSGLTEVMQLRLQNEYPKAYTAVSSSFEMMLMATEKMRNIINHIRIFARQEEMQFSAYPVNQIIHSALLLTQQQLTKQGIHLELHLTAEDTSVMCAHSRLEQVIINLLTNARDAIQSRCDNETHHVGVIEIITKRSGQQITITIKDNGIGIDKECAKRLYDPFFSTKEVGKGTGLGLSISYGILKEHNGTIEMTSTPGEYTEFTILLDTVHQQSVHLIDATKQ